MSDVKIKIESLYKIFGADPQAALPLVREGMGKTELLEKHGHVLGLQDIDLDVPEREIQVVMGLSGSGKSTLIRHINRLIDPTAGKVTVAGEDVLAMSERELREFRRHKASMVFQRFALLPHRTVVWNVTHGLRIQGLPAKVLAERAAEWIDRVGLSGFEDHYPGQLSGGMQQRVGLARALATDPEILLMDEAFSALDPLIRTDMQDVLLTIQKELHKTIVFITHDLDEALRIGDRISILRDGMMIQQGDPEEIVLHPVDEYIESFVRDINRARVLTAGTLAVPGTLNGGPSVNADMTLEDALPILNSSESNQTTVLDVAGNPIGILSIDTAIAAMARPM